MALLQNSFNTASLPKENQIIVLPAGDYIATITKTVLKEKDSTSQYIQLFFTIVDGEHKGKTFMDSLTIKNINPVAVDIGLARLNTYLTIGGISILRDTDNMLNITVLATLNQETYKDNLQNKVKKVSNLEKAVAKKQPTKPAKAEEVEVEDEDISWNTDDDEIPFQ